MRARIWTHGGLLVVLATGVAACGGGSNGSSSGTTATTQDTVPNVVGDTQAAATTAITGAGLTVTVTMQSSATVASGDVISESPAASATAASGAAVTLVVSSGPAPSTVPNVVGDTQAVATTAITGAGLILGTVTQQSSATVASGDVISESPAASASAASGSAVALVVSSGPVTYTVGGMVIGLGSGATVNVQNGADDLAVSANGTFTLPTAVAGGGTYSVSIGTQPTHQTCATQTGAGSVAAANVTSVVIYCTFNASTATWTGTYENVLAGFDSVSGSTTANLDGVGSVSFAGTGTTTSTTTLNVDGTIFPNVAASGTFTITETAAIPLFSNNTGATGGVEGADGDAIVAGIVQSGMQPALGVSVFPNAAATTNSVSGNYTVVAVSGDVTSGVITSIEGSATLTNGTISGTVPLTLNTGGTISTGSTASGTYTVSGGLITTVGDSMGGVSADGDLIVLADDTAGDGPAVEVLLAQASAASVATLQGVYSAVEYGGDLMTTSYCKVATLMFYGNGTFSATVAANASGTVTTDTGSGTYTVTAAGAVTFTLADGEAYTGAVSADGNALVLASQQKPAIVVGLRQ